MLEDEDGMSERGLSSSRRRFEDEEGERNPGNWEFQDEEGE